jgi:hypothetical protein
MQLISRKQRELGEKELRQKEQFLKDTRALLKTEAPSFTAPIPSEQIQLLSNDNYRAKVAEYFTAQGYVLSDEKAEGIDLVGEKEKELLLVRCESDLKEIKKIDLKMFIADCTVYIDTHPLLREKIPVRMYTTNRPITEEAREYVRNHLSSLRLAEEV